LISNKTNLGIFGLNAIRRQAEKESQIHSSPEMNDSLHYDIPGVHLPSIISLLNQFSGDHENIGQGTIIMPSFSE
jgi:hypothetical protein